ncbi:(2Fe-2S)-binding protein [Streptomyces sp. NPDC051014]|uniref:(2Fe-2S)-binding protein n=1 Tax=Streptomyces sp. NPDC051014 TaxID=3155751 RepID=UPI0034093178
MDLDPDLAALRPLGGFFVLRTFRPAAGDPAAGDPAPEDPAAEDPAAEDPAAVRIDGLPRLAQAYGTSPADVERDVLTSRVELVAARLRTDELRVAASIAHQGLAARLWSAALGCAARYGRLPDLDARLLRWDAGAAAPDDLWLTEVRALPGGAEPDTLAEAVVHGHLQPLGETLRARYGVAAGLLWGNAASALAGAARELERWARAGGRTEDVDRIRALADALLAHPLLRAGGVRTGPAFRRRSCCLYYRVPGGGICGDCCFTQPPRSSPRAASG